jgi:tRNA 2-thiocytidine biosynthesis protein TtcA
MLLHRIGGAVADFALIKQGDRVAAALSGGKDSFSLLRLLTLLRSRSPVKFDLIALTIHNGSEHFQSALLEDYLRSEGIPFHLERTEIVSIVEEKLRPGSPHCSLCSRLRRGALYGAAVGLGCNKLALGHHLDDAAETLLMNFFFEGSLKAMPPKLLAENGKVSIIRPLIYVTEQMLRDYASERLFPVIDCGCWLCGQAAQERKKMKSLVEDVSTRYPMVRMSMLSALSNLHPRFLMDRNWYNFESEEVQDGRSGLSNLSSDS